MNTDIRLSVSFWDHPKTVKLERRLGLAGVKSLQILWMWAANNKPDGFLTNVERASNERQTNVKRTFNDEDVEIAARWDGEPNTFASTLVELGWLDEIDGGYLLHGWSERNSWAAKADERGDKARFSRLAKVAPEVFNLLRGQGVTAISKEEYEAVIDVSLTKRQRNVNASLTPAPAPSPSPSPSPKEGKDIVGQGSPTSRAPVDHQEENPTRPDPVPYAAIVAKLNEVCGCQFKASTQTTRRHIKARWNEGWRLPDFEAVVIAKFAEWGSDAEMCRFLRPETLFGTKFEGYLQFAKNGGGALNESTAPANQEELVRKIREQRAERERKALEVRENATA